MNGRSVSVCCRKFSNATAAETARRIPDRRRFGGWIGKSRFEHREAKRRLIEFRLEPFPARGRIHRRVSLPRLGRDGSDGADADQAERQQASLLASTADPAFRASIGPRARPPNHRIWLT